MGTTDAWKPLHALFLLSDHTQKVGVADTTTLPPRSIFLISDGHVSEEAPTIAAIKRGLKQSRLFTFGVE